MPSLVTKKICTLTQSYVQARGQNKFNNRNAAFEKLARLSVPSLDNTEIHENRCYWRLSLAYIRAMNDCENSHSFNAPRSSAAIHGLDLDLVIFARALDTIGPYYMGRNGASFLDDQGMDSLIGCGLANDVMDLHIDIFTGETRNLIRFVCLKPFKPCRPSSPPCSARSYEVIIALAWGIVKTDGHRRPRHHIISA
jgi:hypothetical protein